MRMYIYTQSIDTHKLLPQSFVFGLLSSQCGREVLFVAIDHLHVQMLIYLYIILFDTYFLFLFFLFPKAAQENVLVHTLTFKTDFLLRLYFKYCGSVHCGSVHLVCICQQQQNFYVADIFICIFEFDNVILDFKHFFMLTCFVMIPVYSQCDYNWFDVLSFFKTTINF